MFLVIYIYIYIYIYIEREREREREKRDRQTEQEREREREQEREREKESLRKREIIITSNIRTITSFCYSQNVSTDIYYGLLQVFRVKLGSPHRIERETDRQRETEREREMYFRGALVNIVMMFLRSLDVSRLSTSDPTSLDDSGGIEPSRLG